MYVKKLVNSHQQFRILLSFIGLGALVGPLIGVFLLLVATFPSTSRWFSADKIAGIAAVEVGIVVGMFVHLFVGIACLRGNLWRLSGISMIPVIVIGSGLAVSKNVSGIEDLSNLIPLATLLSLFGGVIAVGIEILYFERTKGNLAEVVTETDIGCAARESNVCENQDVDASLISNRIEDRIKTVLAFIGCGCVVGFLCGVMIAGLSTGVDVVVGGAIGLNWGILLFFTIGVMCIRGNLWRVALLSLIPVFVLVFPYALFSNLKNGGDPMGSALLAVICSLVGGAISVWLERRCFNQKPILFH